MKIRTAAAACLLSISVLLAACQDAAQGTGAVSAEKATKKTRAQEKKKQDLSEEPCRPELAPLPPSGEGMWPWDRLGELDQKALAKRGLKIHLSEIWTPGKGGLARAAVGLKGCTGSFVSANGLLLTNHHCAFLAIQRNSTPKQNLISKGFAARTRQEELDGHGLKVLVFQSQRDVTEQVLGKMPEGADDLERMEHIESREKEIVRSCEEKPNTRCRVSRNNDGLSFVLLENLELRDVRLVAAPPASLGHYGGEVDNWRWPRHTLDFALLRAYVDAQGRPAEYNPLNVPFRPEHHFAIGFQGIAPGDLIMVIGTPHATSRYRTAVSVTGDRQWYHPARVSLFSSWIQVLRRACEEIPDSCLPTSTWVKRLSNGLTNSRGTIEGLDRAGILARKREMEKQWRSWVAASPERRTRYGKVLDDLADYIESTRKGRDLDLLIGYMLRGVHLIGFARTISKWAAQREKPDAEREPGFQERNRDDLKSDLVEAQRSLHLEADRRVLDMFLERFGALPAGERLEAFDEALGGNYSPEAIAGYTEKLYRTTGLGESKERARLFEEGLDELNQSEDSLIRLALFLAPELDAWDQRKKRRKGALSRLRPPYIESIVEMSGSRFYPDANATPRISFATVWGYSPRDGIWHTPLTTLTGLADKHTGKEPFDAPEPVLEAIRAGNCGQYAAPDIGDVPICFLSNADTTGGNSGSPAVDGKGRLVGLNFDRVYENIAGDYGYNPKLSRNIMVDVRAVLWYLDLILGADHILEELGSLIET